MEPNDPHENSREIAIDKYQLERMDYNAKKLKHLQASQVLLPPQILLHLWAQHTKKIIAVHDQVHEGI
jgi:hypothetical protein